MSLHIQGYFYFVLPYNPFNKVAQHHSPDFIVPSDSDDLSPQNNKIDFVPRARPIAASYNKILYRRVYSFPIFFSIETIIL